MDKIAVFIDNGYFEKVCSKLGVPRVDYLKFSEGVCESEGGRRFRTYVYDCMPWRSSQPTAEETARYSRKQGFGRTLERLPNFITRWGRLQKTGDEDRPFRQKGVDTLLAIDLVKLSWTHGIDKAVLVAGDSDFCPAIREAKEANVLVNIYYSKQPFIHDELYELCDDRKEITVSLLKKCALEA